MAFIREQDYAGFIKPEIKLQVTGTTGGTASALQQRAEDTAMATIREYIGGRYDCDAIFTAWDGTGTDPRNKFIVKVVIVLALYDLYHQTGTRDIPEHRKDDYDDMIQWLKDVGRGAIRTTLPTLPDEEYLSEIRINSRKPTDQKW